MNHHPPADPAGYLKYCLRYLPKTEDPPAVRPNPARILQALRKVLPKRHKLEDPIIFVRKWENTQGWRPEARKRRLEYATEMDVVLFEGGMSSSYLEHGVRDACEAGPRSLGIVTDRMFFPESELKVFSEKYVTWVLVTADLKGQRKHLRKHCPHTTFHTFGSEVRLPYGPYAPSVPSMYPPHAA